LDRQEFAVSSEPIHRIWTAEHNKEARGYVPVNINERSITDSGTVQV